jgi:hypothetical protein
MAMRAPAETLAYVALINPQPKKTGLVYACGFQAVQIGNPGNYRLTNAGRRHLYQEVAN